MWYILQADQGAELINGFAGKVSAEEYQEHLAKGTLLDILQSQKVKTGDVIYIPAGRVHAIGKGILLAEIQQSSDITYRLYDYNRKDANGNERELHTEQALDVIDFSENPEKTVNYPSVYGRPVTLVSSPYFTTRLIRLKEDLRLEYEHLDSFVVYLCTGGSATITVPGNDPVSISTGESVLIPAIFDEVLLSPSGDCCLLETFILQEDDHQES
jgi:mannose-6-phosphate isomerase